MKTKPGFFVQKVLGENIIIADGVENIDFNRIISINETALCIWEGVANREFTVEDMADVVMKEYDVDAPTALADCQTLAKQWLEAGIIEE